MSKSLTSSKIIAEIRNRTTDGEDRFVNHLKTIFNRESDYHGMIGDGYFKMWRFNHWTGFFYSVVRGDFIGESENLRIKLSTKLNPVGCLLIIVFFPVWSFVVGSMVFADGNFWNAPIARLLAGLFLIGVFAIPLMAVYRNQRNEVLSEVEEMINKPESAERH